MVVRTSYFESAPSLQNAVDTLPGAWACRMPESLAVSAGVANLYEDERLSWWGDQLQGWAGKNVLELGPLEGLHTAAMEHAGAASVTAVEADPKSFLKCLVTKELLGLTRTRFLAGNFTSYLDNMEPGQFDVILCSGVLYHMVDPVRLLDQLGRVANAVCIWTHYYDGDLIKNSHSSGGFGPHIPSIHDGVNISLHMQHYGSALNRNDYCGGSAPFSFWLEREDILALLRRHFQTVRVGLEFLNGPHGPAFTLFCRKD